MVPKFESQKIQNSIRAFASNLLDFENKQLKTDAKRIKVLKELRLKHAILKPDKGNGVVLIKTADYILSMNQLFSVKDKFRKTHLDSTLTQLNTLQNYLRTIFNRGEISNSEYNNIRPASTQPARGHGPLKIHKSFDILPPFRPIIDTTGTAYQSVAKFLTKLLNPFTNKFSGKDTFDAVSHVNNLPRKLFDDRYRFVSFDVKCFFTNVPLKKTVDIFLNRIYKSKLISTTLTKRTL